MHRAGTWNWSDGECWCALEGSFPSGVAELSEAADDSLLHLTASRSNNCKSHLWETRPPHDWSMWTGSFKASAHIAQNREQHIFLRAQLSLPFKLYNKLYFSSIHENTAAKCFTNNKTRDVFNNKHRCLQFFWIQWCRSNFITLAYYFLNNRTEHFKSHYSSELLLL